jgi:sugar/nucleoside kinase (ribokinase family)
MIRPGGPAAGSRVVCVGDVLLDICALLPGPLVQGSDTPAPVSYAHGGAAANTAAWLASLGVPCAFAGRVGDDAFGREAVAALRAAGVRTRVTTDPVAATGACLVLIGPDGERTMVPSAGANAALGPADLGPDLLRAGDHLHLSGYTLLNDGSRAAALFALQLAGSAGASVSVDAASAGPIRTVGAGRFLEWLPAGALLLANLDELAALTGTADEDAGIAALVARGLDVVVKCGSRGSVLGTAAGLRRVPTTPVGVLDSTGAGDAFAAGLLAALCNGADVGAALAEGNRLGGLVVGRLGARP